MRPRNFLCENPFVGFLDMKLRDLMIERILFVMDEETLVDEFGVNAEDLTVLPVEDFLDLYDSIFSFQG
jgi:hypothetical protein